MFLTNVKKTETLKCLHLPFFLPNFQPSNLKHNNTDLPQSYDQHCHIQHERHENPDSFLWCRRMERNISQPKQRIRDEKDTGIVMDSTILWVHAFRAGFWSCVPWIRPRLGAFLEVYLLCFYLKTKEQLINSRNNIFI